MNRKPGKRKSKNSENNGNVPVAKTPKLENNLQVTGVSRSGRVRKKSSKLLGYESGAEEFDRPRKKLDASAINNSQRTNVSKDSLHEYGDNEGLVNSSQTRQESLESEGETSAYPPAEASDDSSVDTSGTELEDDLLDDKLNADDGPTSSHTEITYSRPATNAASHSSQKSLYMLESYAKKRKNGRGPKAGRKDKGKARFSAYMLWAREVRPDLMKCNPNIDFSQLSSKLSDLWATVPYSDKYMWKQKAKRMAMLAKNMDTQEEANVQKAQNKTTLRRKYINKKNISPPNNKTTTDIKSTSMLTEITSSTTPSLPINDTKSVSNETNTLSKPVSTQPLDVAAHLKLLGESLSIIGQRLKEHEGQIAVSGSLSVLLDTLLCSLGPLLCLTRQVEEMNGCSEETLSKILDNIAYIMPGL